MEEEKKGKKGYVTLTYRLRFYDKHLDWLWQTKILYNRVVEHYYNLLLEHFDLLALSNHALMRELEIITIGTKEMKKTGQIAPYPLVDFPSVPLYFRRAAISSSISMVRSFQTQKLAADLQLEKAGIVPSRAERFSVAPVYYKGMYKDLKENSILLKVFTGDKWVWNCYRFSGRILPEDAETLSPTIYLEKKQAYLHVPVKKEIEHIQTVKERMETAKRILAVSFPGSDSIAVGAVMMREGSFEKAVFFHGGLEMKARKNRLKRKLIKLKKSNIPENANQMEGSKAEQYRKKIHNINEYYAHLVSRKILDYCKEQKIEIIAVPNYRQSIDFSKKRYLKMDSYEWIGRRIIRFLKYKAFSEGILVSSVPLLHIADSCSECGERIKRYNEGHTPGKNYLGGQLFCCSNGHQGNSGLNTARNVGKKFLSYYK